MAGSFDIFRKYQRSLLVAVAILAMLAFFVLPPFLQMGSSNSSYGDPVAVSWAGGSLRESELERAVAMQSAVNRFLLQSVQTAGRDPSRISLFPENEQSVVRTMLLAQEARSNGVVVSDRAVNDYLSQLTSDMVKPEQLDAIISGLRIGPMGVSQADLFSALRTDRAAWASLIMAQASFSGDPPGWRWEAFRKLEQSAVVEVVPVDVRSLADEVQAPTETEMRELFERYKERLPEPSSRDPGFREPHRVQAEYLVANLKAFDETVKGEVTDEAISEFYEKNKEKLFRAKKRADGEKAADEKPAEKSEAAGNTAAAAEKKGDAGEAKAAADESAKEADRPAAEGDRIEREAKRVNTDDSAAPGDAVPAGGVVPERAPADSSPAGNAPAQSAQATPATGSPEEAKAAEVECEPLENVKEKIREQLVRERAEMKIDAIFTAVASDVTGYAEDLAVWRARNDGNSAEPRRPDVAAIAKVQGLESGSTAMVSVLDASEISGIGRSFEILRDPSSRFGYRERAWLETMFGSGSLLHRPATSRDGVNRYLSWKIEDRPEHVPTFEEAKANVEKAWRIVEARSRAFEKAASIAKKAEADKTTLEAVVAGRDDVKATQVGPFTWLTQGAAPLDAPPVLSSPKGLDLAGEAFMKAVFALEPGGTAVVFNEPETICYCVRLVSYEPTEDDLRRRFLDDREDQSRLVMVSQRQYQRQFGEWVAGLDRKYGVEWKRPPRMLRGE